MEAVLILPKGMGVVFFQFQYNCCDSCTHCCSSLIHVYVVFILIGWIDVGNALRSGSMHIFFKSGGRK